MTAFTTTSSANSSQSAADCAGPSLSKALCAPSNERSSQSSLTNGNVMVPSKGRFSSKLSSRHNRRKRRERENKDPAARRSRGVKRSRDRIPIPSFTPLTEVFHNEGGMMVEGGTGVPETMKASSSRCPTVGVSDTTKLFANIPAAKADYETNQTHEVQKIDHICNTDKAVDEPASADNLVKEQKIAHTTHAKDDSRATEAQQTKKNAYSADFLSFPNREDLRQTVKQKSSPRDPAKISAGPLSSAPSTSEEIPHNAQEQPAAQFADGNYICSQYLPESEERSGMGDRHRDMIREEINSGEGKAEGAGERSPKETENQPHHEVPSNKSKTPDGALSKRFESGLEMEAFQIISSAHNAKGLMLSGSRTPTLVQAKKNKKPSSDYVDKGIINTGRNVNDPFNRVGSADSGLLENKNAVDEEAEKMDMETYFDIDKDSKTHHCNETHHDRDNPRMGDNPSSIRGESFTANQSSSSPLVRQVEKKQKMCTNVNNRNKHSKSGDFTKSPPPEVIEIIDDDDGIDIRTMSKAEKEQALKSISTDKKGGIIGKKRKPKSSNQTRKKRKEAVNISRSSSDSSLGEFDNDTKRGKKARDGSSLTKQWNKTVKVKEKKNSKQSKTLAGNRLCFACSSCKCNSRAGSAATPQKLSSLSGSDARQEQSLANRLQRIERDIAWKEGQRNDVARELKKRRGQMLKKWEGQSSNTKGQRPRFLADAEVSEELRDSHSKISSAEVNRAKCRIFGKQKKHQPTLTQIIGGPKDGGGEESTSELDCNGNDVKSNCADDLPNKADEAGLRGGNNDFLAFWDDSALMEHSTQCKGSMNYFNRAIANFKEMKCTGKWAKATANMLQIEEEEGFDALVDLFDASMEKSCIDCSQNSIDGDDDCMSEESLSPISRPLTPKGKRIAKDIETSVEGDPPKLAAIERMCPNWKENIQLVQAQTDPKDLHNALLNVQQAKVDLENMKEKIVQAFLDRQQTLNLYEKSLQGALVRLSENEGEADSIDPKNIYS